MIPKVIHLCWLSGDKYPALVQQCIDSWKRVLPDFEIKKWDSNSFDFASVPFVKQAYENKQWAFVSDYIRLYAIYTEGGIYLDSDVMVYQRFDEWLNYSFFTAIEKRTLPYIGFWMEAAIMASEPGNPMIKEIMGHYEHTNFIDENDRMIRTPAPDIYTPIFCKHYGWKPGEGKALLKDNVVVFGADEITSTQYPLKPTVRLYHCNNMSWIPLSPFHRFCKKFGLMSFYNKLAKLNRDKDGNYRISLTRVCRKIKGQPLY